MTDSTPSVSERAEPTLMCACGRCEGKLRRGVTRSVRTGELDRCADGELREFCEGSYHRYIALYGRADADAAFTWEPLAAPHGGTKTNG